MIVYVETSALLDWLLGSSGGARSLRILRAAERVVCSRLTIAEARRVLIRSLSEGLLKPQEMAKARARLDAAARDWTLMEVTEDVWARVESPFPVEPVGTLDAIHLATALRFHDLLASVRLLSTDDRVVANWKAMALPLA